MAPAPGGPRALQPCEPPGANQGAEASSSETARHPGEVRPEVILAAESPAHASAPTDVRAARAASAHTPLAFVQGVSQTRPRLGALLREMFAGAAASALAAASYVGLTPNVAAPEWMASTTDPTRGAALLERRTAMGAKSVLNSTAAGAAAAAVIHQLLRRQNSVPGTISVGGALTSNGGLATLSCAF